MKPRLRISVRIHTMTPSRTDSASAPPDSSAHPASPAAPAVTTGASMWGELAHVGRRGWLAVGAIAAVGALAGAAMGAGVHESPLIPLVLLAAMAVVTARAGWSWVAGPSRRARVRDSLLGHVEEYGGGVYGTGGAITLLVLSASSVQAEWAAASGMMDFMRGMTLEFWIGFSADSIGNAIQAGMWPLHWYANHGLAAALAVGAAAWAGDAVADHWRNRDVPEAGELVAAEGVQAGAASPR